MQYGALIDANSDGVPDVAQGSAPAADTLDVIVRQTVYDPRLTAAGRIVRTIDNAGRIDEVHSDLLGRTVRTIQNYDDGTAGETDTDRDITVEYEYDFAGRMVTLAALNAKGAGNGTQRQETRYLYESAVNGAWQTAVVYPDSTDTLSQGADGAWTITGGTDHVAIAHDRLGRAVATTDQRGVERVFLYDSAGRLTLDHATDLGDAGQNVDGTVRALETLYDDLGRVRSITSLGYDAFDEPTVALNEVRYRYDGWGNLAQEWQAHDGEVGTQTTPSVQYVYDDGASGGVAAYVRLDELIYPNGRTLTYGYGQAGGVDDVLSRVATIATGQDVHAQYAYLGLSTIVEEAFTQPDVRLNYDTGGDNTLAGFDRFGRVVDHVWEQYGGQQPAAVDRFQYGYDSAGNRVWRKNVVAHGQSLAFDEVYGLDDLGRLIAAERGYLQSVDPVSLTARAFEQEWGLDGTGNWAAFNEDLDGTGWDLQQTRLHNAANEVTGATDWAAPAHDRAGNMTALPKPASPADALGATYDAWNRLVAVSEGGVLIAKFSYDAAGRRILKQLADAQEPDEYIHYYHSGQQVVETRAGDDSSGVPDPAQLAPAYQFVWSPRYIDALILRDQYDAQGQLDAGARLFYLADANHNVTGIVGLVETEPDVFEWQVVERYVYSPYGAATIYTPDWSATRAESAHDNTTLYTGREFDPATGLYYYRARYYHAQLGQFISRDPIGYEAGDVNLYRYVGGRPISATDPSGLLTTKDAKKLVDRHDLWRTFNLSHDQMVSAIIMDSLMMTNGNAAEALALVLEIRNSPVVIDNDVWACVDHFFNNWTAQNHTPSVTHMGGVFRGTAGFLSGLGAIVLYHGGKTIPHVRENWLPRDREDVPPSDVTAAQARWAFRGARAAFWYPTDFVMGSAEWRSLLRWLDR